ncbi:MAG TPA: hypothetical protein VK453_25085 [Micromonosporaceae bacterium]|nr:hypothetical protein [Micromonosporaceae bacterium]
MLTEVGERDTHRRAAIAAWFAIAASDLLASTRRVPRMPTNLHTAAVGAAVALTVVAAIRRHHAPVRAAFLDGMLYERQSRAGTSRPADPGGTDARVFKFSAPDHRQAQ